MTVYPMNDKTKEKAWEFWLEGYQQAKGGMWSDIDEQVARENIQLGNVGRRMLILNDTIDGKQQRSITASTVGRLMNLST